MVSIEQTVPATFVDGAAVTLVLLHYLGGSRRTWSPTIPYLSDTFQFIPLDTPGYGDAIEISGYSVQEMAAYFDSVIREQRLTRVILVGHSMSAKVALVMAAAVPDYLRGIVLVTPSPPCPQPITQDDRAAQLAFHNQRDEAEAFVDKSHVLPLPEAWRTLAIEDVMRCNPAAFHAWARSGMEEDWSHRIGQVRIPALIVCGGADVNVPDAQGQREMTLSHLPFGTLEILPGRGHLLPMEAPAALAALLRNFALSTASSSAS